MASGSTRSPKRKLEAELARLETLDLDGLRAAWVRRYGDEPPIRRSRDVLMRLLAWRLQEDHYGGLDPKMLQAVRRLGDLHDVEDGALLPAGARWARLSEADLAEFAGDDPQGS